MGYKRNIIRFLLAHSHNQKNMVSLTKIKNYLEFYYGMKRRQSIYKALKELDRIGFLEFHKTANNVTYVGYFSDYPFMDSIKRKFMLTKVRTVNKGENNDLDLAELQKAKQEVAIPNETGKVDNDNTVRAGYSHADGYQRAGTKTMNQLNRKTQNLIRKYRLVASSGIKNVGHTPVTVYTPKPAKHNDKNNGHDKPDNSYN